MAYKGSTALSSDANPPRAMFSGMWGARSTNILPVEVGGQNLWLYNSTDSSTEFSAANWFVDGFYLGMQEGDMIMGACATGSSKIPYVGVIGAVTTAGCAIASTGSIISSTNS